jgi:ribulose-bisphosphate carboxylase large chain
MDIEARSGQALRVTYALAAPALAEAEAKARDIALEQTVELPEGTFAPAVGERMAGRVEIVEPAGESRWRTVIAYPAGVVGGDLAQLLNVLFGNSSLKEGIRITAVDWPEGLLARFPGPRFGVAGLRELCNVFERRPLLCAALKPVGLSVEDLADLAHEFALGRVDLIKDDHGLTDQETAPFAERVERCQEVVALANREVYGTALYFPNVTSGPAELPTRVAAARAAGCQGVLVSPLLVGLDTVRWLAENSGMAVLAHPSLAGGFFGPGHGIAPEVLLGDLFRLAGSDGVIYPNAGGRFPLSEATCAAINDHLARPLGSLRPAFPVPGGGIDVARVPYWLERYGPDTIYLIGGSLYAQPNLMAATRRLAEAVRGGASG